MELAQSHKEQRRCSQYNHIWQNSTLIYTKYFHRRLKEHRSDINTEKETQIAAHFNDVCPNIEYLNIIYQENVPHKIKINTFMNYLAYEDLLDLLKMEQVWIM